MTRSGGNMGRRANMVCPASAHGGGAAVQFTGETGEKNMICKAQTNLFSSRLFEVFK